MVRFIEQLRVLCCFQSKWLTCERQDERDERQGIIAHPQPSFADVKAGLDCSWGGVWLGWSSAIDRLRFKEVDKD